MTKIRGSAVLMRQGHSGSSGVKVRGKAQTGNGREIRETPTGRGDERKQQRKGGRSVNDVTKEGTKTKRSYKKNPTYAQEHGEDKVTSRSHLKKRAFASTSALILTIV